VKLTKELKTGLLAVFAIATFILGYNYLKGTSLFQTDRIFYSVYDNVEGLAVSSAVTLNGLKIGKVQSIDIQGNTGNLIVKFSVENDFDFSKESIARIYGGGIIGGKSLAIIPNFESRNYAVSGDTLKGHVEEGIMELVNDRLSPLQKKVESAIVGVDSLMFAVNDVMDAKSRKSLRETIDNLNKITSSFAVSSNSLENLLINNENKLNRTFTNLDATAENFAKLSDSLSQINFSQMVNELETTLANFKELSENLNSGEGTLGKLLTDDSLYVNLEYATRQLEQLLQDIKLNPKRYIHISVFGKRPGPYQEPESRKD
jgi:phospholipid/cholesterol/gamma-HCH transport system substrate-binding protein